MALSEKAAQASLEQQEYGIDRTATIEPYPDAARAEAGVLLEVGDENTSHLQLAKDGHTVLLPQPTRDASDPLNWSWTRKHLVLFTVAFGALCADFTSASGTATIFLQGAEWRMNPTHVNYAGNLNVLMMGIGGLIWVPMVSYFGRAPVLFWTTIFGFVFSILAAKSTYFTEFYAMRALTGLFITAAQTISIAFLKDMFFFHERARKIGLWAALYISSPYIGPCLANFIVARTGKWQNVFWMDVGVVALQILFILTVVDETFYNRDISQSLQPARDPSLLGRLSRIVGIWQIKHHSLYFYSFVDAYKRLFKTLFKPAFLLIALNYLCIFAWAIGINITTSILFLTPVAYGGYGYSNLGLGCLYFTPIVGIMLGELFGHFFNDALAHRYTHKHKGIFEPEVRLLTIYIASVPMMAGLILVGQSLYHHLPVAGIIFGWGMHSFGVMTNSVATTSYALDSYPTVPAEIACWINFARVIGGFSVGYYQQPWGNRVGYDASFGTQAAIVGFSLVFVVSANIWGHKLRLRSGPVT